MWMKQRWLRWTIGVILSVSVLSMGIRRLTADPNHRAIAIPYGTHPLAVNPDRTVLATTSGRKIILWQLPDVTVIRELRNPALIDPWMIAWRPDGQALAVQNGLNSDVVVVYHLADDTVSVVTQGRKLGVISLAWSADAQWLAIGTQSQVDLVHMPDGHRIHTLAQHPRHLPSGLYNAPEALIFDPTGETLLTGNSDGTVHRWRVRDGTLLSAVQAHSAMVTSMAISPDGQTLATGSADTTIGLWNVADGTLRATLRGHQERVTSVAWSVDGQLLASGAGNPDARYYEDLRHVDTSVRVWQVQDGQLRFTFEGTPHPIIGVAFVGTSPWLISGAPYDGIRRWRWR